MSKKNKKKTWGTNWLTPHVAQPTPPPAPPRILQLHIAPPPHWSAEKRRLFGMIEQSLLRMKQFTRISVLPDGCLFATVAVEHDIRGPRAA